MVYSIVILFDTKRPTYWPDTQPTQIDQGHKQFKDKSHSFEEENIKNTHNFSIGIHGM